MKILRLSSLEHFHLATAVTIGNFDGGHRGHQALLAQLKDNAGQRPTVVVSFEPSSREYFAQQRGEMPPARLSSFQEKAVFFQQQNLDYWLCLPFARIVNWSAATFVEQILLAGLKSEVLVVGDDFHFGKDRLGNIDFIKKTLDAAAKVLPAKTVCDPAGLRISSSRVRQALAVPDLSLAQYLLGRPYQLLGRVEKGQKLGRQLGFPTANLGLNRQTSPLRGVFVVQVAHGQKPNTGSYFGLANLGLRPTVTAGVAGKTLRPEVHIFDFNGDLYGKKLAVTFLHFLRHEQRFPNLSALQTAIVADKAAAKAWLSHNNQCYK